MASRDLLTAFPPEHQAFLDDFQALTKKHPGAVKRCKPISPQV